MNTNRKSNHCKTGKSETGFAKGDILLGFFLLMGSDFLALFLPKPLVVVLWIIAALAVVKRKVLPLLKNHRFLLTAEKMVKRITVIANMRDADFEERFAPKTIPHTSPAQSAPKTPASSPDIATKPFMPSYACKREMSANQAAKLAKTWWESAGTDGSTGAQRVEELIHEICAEKPNSRTAILTEYAERLALPREEPVLTQLVNVVKADGLAAELSEDGSLIILWGQDESGREAGMN